MAQDLLDAFECYVSEAISGTSGFGEFCGEFGYDEDSRKAHETWRACVKAKKSLKRIYDGDLCKLQEGLQDGK